MEDFVRDNSAATNTKLNVYWVGSSNLRGDQRLTNRDKPPPLVHFTRSKGYDGHPNPINRRWMVGLTQDDQFLGF